jgi:hypothetical protein
MSPLVGVPVKFFECTSTISDPQIFFSSVYMLDKACFISLCCIKKVQSL